MTTKIAVGLALLLALAGWGLYEQVSANGKMHEQIQQIEADLKAERGRVETLRLEIEERDQAVQRLQARYDKLREKKAVVQTIVKEVYREPEVEEWAQAVPPDAVVRAVHAAIDCLHDPASGQDGGCRDFTAGGDDARLPSP